MTAKTKMYTVTVNKEYGSKEVMFYSKPSDTARAALKDHRFRWNGKAKLWYGFICLDDLEELLRTYGYCKVDRLPEKRTAWNSKKAEREKREEDNAKAYEKYCEEQTALLESLGEEGYMQMLEDDMRTAREEIEKFQTEKFGTVDTIDDNELENFENDDPDIFDNEVKNGYYYTDDRRLIHYTNGVIDLLEI